MSYTPTTWVELVTKVGPTNLNHLEQGLQAAAAVADSALAAAGAVSSVFGRTGAIAATTGDYTAAKVTNAADTASASQQTFTGNVSTPALIAAGLTGATSASRYVGATASGAPASGTFSIGDFIIDRTGKLYVCTTAGSPGTWTQVGASSGPTIYKNNFDIVNTAAETNLISQSVSGNTLGANGALLVTIEADYFNNSGAGRTLEVKIKLGATTLWDDVSGAITASATHRPFSLQFLLANEGATNAQRMAGSIRIGAASAAVAGIGSFAAGADLVQFAIGGSSAEDTTAAKTLVVSAIHATNNVSLELKGAVSAIVLT